MISNKYINTEEQQGFLCNGSTADVIFIVRQIAEKAREFNTPAYMCFIDLIKAFDYVKLTDILNILREGNIPQKIIHSRYQFKKYLQN